MIDCGTRRLIAVARAAAFRSLEPPGSTLKPLVLAALLESGRLNAAETMVCPRRLRIRGRSFDCAHPELAEPVNAALALAYSCNCYVAHAAERFRPGELARELERFGLASPTGLAGEDEAHGRIRAAMDPDDQRMQALGEYGVEVTPAEIAMAYVRLALKTGTPGMRAIREGMEGAVEFGTARKARVAGVPIAGKTGSAMSQRGEPVAWFAGFVPSASPQAALAVMLPGRSGGSDAAPAARKIFEAYTAGTL